MITASHRLTLSAALILLTAALAHANSNFVAFMNSRVGTWEHHGKQTGPEKFEWTTKEVVTRRGSGPSQRWESKQRIKFTDGVVRNDTMTTRLKRGGGWITEGSYGEGQYYPNGKVKMTKNGNVARGRWTLKGRKTMHVTYSMGRYKQTSTTTVINPKRYRSIGTASDGTRTVINARKVR
jgi:hypothetical protein